MFLLLVAGLIAAPGCRSGAAPRARLAAVPCDDLHLVYETSPQRLGLQPRWWGRLVGSDESAALNDPSARCWLHVWRVDGEATTHAVLVLQWCPPGRGVQSACKSLSWTMPLPRWQVDELLLDLQGLAADSPASGAPQLAADGGADAAVCLAIDGHTTAHCGQAVAALDALACTIFRQGRHAALGELPSAPALPAPAASVLAYRRAGQRESAAAAHHVGQPSARPDPQDAIPRVVALPALDGGAAPQRQ